MTTSLTIRRSVSYLILAVSAMLWILLLLNPWQLLIVRHCAFSATGSLRASWQLLLAINPVSALLAGWMLMVTAMMLPKLIAPVHYIFERSLKRRRLRSAILFILAYMSTWLCAGVLMIAVIVQLNLLMPKSYLPAIGLGFIAIIWQFSPLKQRCLNRGHDHRTLSAFGWKADRDALLFGALHGFWCIGSGWALMLFPMSLPEGHNLAMFAVTILMVSEHLEHPRAPRWRVNLSAKLLRILLAQTGARLQQARNPH